MNEVQIFNNSEFGDVRTVTVDCEIWFVGRDVAAALGYQKPETSVRDRVSERDTEKFGISDSNNHTQQMICINEAGLYTLIFGSKLESARRFQDWVTHDVLPSIRKTGSYTQESKLPTTTRGQVLLLMRANEETNVRIDKLEEDISTMKQDMPLFPDDTKTITEAVKKKGVSILGGKDSDAYHDRGLVNSVYRDIYAEIHRNFDVSRYTSIKRADVGRVLSVVDRYSPPLCLAERIQQANEVA